MISKLSAKCKLITLYRRLFSLDNNHEIIKSHEIGNYGNTVIVKENNREIPKDNRAFVYSFGEQQ